MDGGGFRCHESGVYVCYFFFLFSPLGLELLEVSRSSYVPFPPSPTTQCHECVVIRELRYWGGGGGGD